MLEDYDYLWTTIQENYAMMNVAQRMTGKNFLAVKDHYRNKITEDTTTQQFDSYVSLFLNEFEGIHLHCQQRACHLSCCILVHAQLRH